MWRDDCFAFMDSDENYMPPKCRALTRSNTCEKRSFFKTYRQYALERDRAAERLKRKGLTRCVRFNGDQKIISVCPDFDDGGNSEE